MSIASRIEAIEQHLTDDYNVLEVAGADLTNVDKNILNLKPTWKERLLYFMNNGTDVVWDNWEKVVGEGTTITLDNTEEAPMKIVLKGNTSQESTTGKNLYDDIYSDYTRPADYIICPITLEQGQTYTLSSTLIGTKVTGIVAGIVPYGEKYTDFVNKLNLTIESGGNTYRKVFTVNETYTSPKVVLYVGSNPSTLESTFDNIFNNYHIQLEKGNIASPTYEPYTGGIPAPNPDFPEDVHTVSGDNEITICGKNFFDVSKVSNLALSGTVVSNPTYRGYSLKVNSGETYTISRKDTTLPNRFRVCFTKIEPANNVDFYGETGVIQSYVELGNATSGTVTVPSGMNYMFLYLSNNNETITTEMEIQIEKSSTATPYEPYQSASYPVNLGVKDLANIVLDNTISTTTLFKTYTLQPNTQYTISTNTYLTSLVVANIFASAGTSLTPSTSSNGVNGSRVVTSDSNGNITIGYRNYENTLDYSSGDYYVYMIEGDKEQQVSETPIELCKIGDYQDTIVKDNDKWYLNKQIGKVVLNGSESGWLERGNTSENYIKFRNANALPYDSKGDLLLISDYFVTNIGANNASYSGNAICGNSGNYAKWLHISIDNTIVNSVETFKTWLSTHNTTVYYALQTPTYTEITDSTLLSQLNTLAKSYASQTNISQESNDLASLLNATALKEMA